MEAASSALIIAIGAWLLVQAFRGHQHGEAGSNRILAIAAGFVPCPLTTFIMVYALSHGMVVAGLVVTAATAGGMILTISDFAAAAALLRDDVFHFLQRRERLWHRARHAFEIVSAAATDNNPVDDTFLSWSFARLLTLDIAIAADNSLIQRNRLGFETVTAQSHRHLRKGCGSYLKLHPAGPSRSVMKDKGNGNHTDNWVDIGLLYSNSCLKGPCAIAP